MKIFYDNKIAKALLFGDYSTVMLFGFVLTKFQDGELSERTKKHESIHVRQYWECFIAGLLIACSLICFGCSCWWLLLPVFLYYLLYGIEWAISFIHHFFSTKKKEFVKANGKAYRNSAMEMEAYENENNLNYFKLFGFLKYYGKL